jgi:hypothetical protein
MSSFHFDFIPGHWYVRLVYKSCKTKHVLFPDVTDGKVKLNAFYYWTCPTCRHYDQYDSDDLERYRHPVSHAEPERAKRIP